MTRATPFGGLALIGALLTAGSPSVAAQGVSQRLDLGTPAARQAAVQELQQRSVLARQTAEALARARGWPVRGELTDGGVFELEGMAGGRLRYFVTANANAAISTAAYAIRNTAPYNLSGAGYTVGIWDAGAVRATHQEFNSRVTNVEGGAFQSHSTHVAGTIGAFGVYPAAQGMAPAVAVDSYNWTYDRSEVAGRAATAPGQPGTIHVSNHSYAYVTGWDSSFAWSGNPGPHYFGEPGEREDRRFGQYSGEAVAWDDLLYAAPYYLTFFAAGNDRDDPAPSSGTTYFYYNGTSWVAKSYDPTTDPFRDGWDNGGFDTMGEVAAAKNLMAVGSVNDAVSGGVRALASATMSGFSNWGPADDGRIKPDLVANGAGVTSTWSTADNAYASMSGTSSSTPNACGSAILLVELFGNLFPGQAMRASTLKGLLLHTADDLGRAGPDYSFGWGLMNVETAANQILAHAAAPSSHGLFEGLLDATHPTATFAFRWDGTSPIRATLCWTDPAGEPRAGLDDRSPTLVNDLDLRITGPGGTPTYYPFVLDVNSPAAVATTGDNVVDNVEQVKVASPTSGLYTLSVSHKGTLADSPQHFSIILSGQDRTPPTVTITAPTSNPTYFSAADVVNLGGTASDNLQVAEVTWANDRGGSGTATGTTSWGVSGIVLQTGVNVLTVSARDETGNVGSDTLTVTYQLPTAVTLTAFAATSTAPDRATLTWQTGVAVDILGFYIDRQLADGTWTRLTDQIIATEDVLVPRLYGTEVLLPDTSGSGQYRLIAVDLRGRERVLAEAQSSAALRVAGRRDADGFVLAIQGPPQGRLHLQSTSAQLPALWEDVEMVSLDDVGHAELTVPISWLESGRFYRLRAAP